MNDIISDEPMHDDVIDGGDELSRMGIAWFVLRAYWAYVNSDERRWANTATIAVRKNAFRRTWDAITAGGEKLHRLFLEYIIHDATSAKINRNRLGVSAGEVRELANEILTRNVSLNIRPEAYLAMNAHEKLPKWLAEYRKGDEFSLKDFLFGRTVFYPGSWFDSEPMMIFGRSSSAHAFIYADYNASIEPPHLTKTEFIELFRTEFHLDGYRVLDVELFDANVMNAAIRWSPHLTPEELRNVADSYRNMAHRSDQFSYFIVLEREDGFGEASGPDRLALWFISGDGIATYDAVYASGNAVPPFGMVHQDHGFGGNYTNYGNDGLLHVIAERCNVFPRFILHGQGGLGIRWRGYGEVHGVSNTQERNRTLLERNEA